jgi:hypothetical protein
VDQDRSRRCGEFIGSWWTPLLLFRDLDERFFRFLTETMTPTGTPSTRRNCPAPGCGRGRHRRGTRLDRRQGSTSEPDSAASAPGSASAATTAWRDVALLERRNTITGT